MGDRTATGRKADTFRPVGFMDPLAEGQVPRALPAPKPATEAAA